MSVIQEILRHKKEELKERKSLVSLKELKERARGIETRQSFKEAIKRKQNDPVKLIAEIKKASPSGGLIREEFNLSDIVSIYEKKGVNAVSILTDERFFKGRLDYLSKARRETKKPLLRKDFIIDDYQVYESVVNGADAILLIVSALETSQLADLMRLAAELSLDSLVEVHALKELDTAVYLGAEIIGINNRSLKTLEVDLKTTFELLKDVPDGKIIVSESGIDTRSDVEAIASTKVDAILVGTAIMKSRDIGAKIDELLGRK